MSIEKSVDTTYADINENIKLKPLDFAIPFGGLIQYTNRNDNFDRRLAHTYNNKQLTQMVANSLALGVYNLVLGIASGYGLLKLIE